MRFITSSYIILALDGFGYIHGKGLAVIGGKGNREVCPDCPDNYNAEELTWALVTLGIVTGLFLSICFCRFYPKLRQLFVSPSVTSEGEIRTLTSTSKPCQCNTIIKRGSINPITTSTTSSPALSSNHQQQKHSTSSSSTKNATNMNTKNSSSQGIIGSGVGGVGKIIGLSKSLVNEHNRQDNNSNMIPKGNGRVNLSSYQVEPVLYSSSSSSTTSTVNHPHYHTLVNQQQRSSSSSLISSGTTITTVTTSTSLPPSHSSIASSIASSSSISSNHHHLHHHQQHQQQHQQQQTSQHKHPYPSHSYPNRSSTKLRSSSSTIAPTTSPPPTVIPTTTIIDPSEINSSSCQQLILSCPQQTQIPIVPIISGQSNVYSSHI